MNPVEQYMENRLEERRDNGNLRTLKTVEGLIDFCSNDYLGFATQNLFRVTDADIHNGSTGSRLITGNSQTKEALEHDIAAFHQTEAALLFNSGYDANVGLLSAIADRHTIFISDELCHASIIDGIRLSSGAGKFKFKHNDFDSLEEKLKANASKPICVVVESLYSMDGDVAPLAEIAALTNQYNALLIVDEAHATGVYGDRGEGIVQQLGLQESVFARVHTYGKAMGCHGATVVGSNMLRQYLINFARSFIYTTALPPHAVNTIAAAYQYLKSPAFSNKPLHELIAYFKEGIGPMKQTNATWLNSTSPIQALILGDNNKTKELTKQLANAGMHVHPILQPTVSEGTERIRICLHAFNTKEQVDLLLNTIDNYLCG